MSDYQSMGYDMFFRRHIPSNPNATSAVGYDSEQEGNQNSEYSLEDQAVSTRKIKNLAVTNAKIKDLSAEKILAGTIGVGLNVGGPSVRILGENTDGGTIVFYNNNIPSIIIGNPDFI